MASDWLAQRFWALDMQQRSSWDGLEKDDEKLGDTKVWGELGRCQGVHKTGCVFSLGC